MLDGGRTTPGHDVVAARCTRTRLRCRDRRCAAVGGEFGYGIVGRKAEAPWVPCVPAQAAPGSVL